MNSAAQSDVELNDDAGGALRAAAKPGLAIELIRLGCALSHGTIAACSARPAAYQPALRAPGQICHEGAQARTAALERAALMRIVKQVRAIRGDALSLWADFVTHANSRYMDAIISPFRRPIFRRPDRLTP